MNNKKVYWGTLALLAVIALLFLLPPLPKTKARAQRIQTVNHLWSASITLPGTNTVSTVAPGK